VIKAEHAQTKSGNGAIGYYHRSKLCCLGIYLLISIEDHLCINL